MVKSEAQNEQKRARTSLKLYAVLSKHTKPGGFCQVKWEELTEMFARKPVAILL